MLYDFTQGYGLPRPEDEARRPAVSIAPCTVCQTDLEFITDWIGRLWQVCPRCRTEQLVPRQTPPPAPDRQQRRSRGPEKKRP